ncbi:conserved hypothetical protein [Parafrankia sp. EAN1pec]|uniref:hypothetical protein n=1 Tax=Parafrankia sp. (strain EAN1pec) TaxID=298653 RepID=UPI0000542AC9|nr:conserved hypothetical protein [Frankia sp. EAN1pec]
MDADVSAIVAQLGEVTAADSQALEHICGTTAARLVEAGVEPPFELTTTDLAADPWLICAERYWGRRLRTHPGVETAALCARWLGTRTAGLTPHQRAAISESWALSFAFATRDTVESHHDLTAAVDSIVRQFAGSSPEVCAFAAMYHASKLRTNYWFDELHLFLESSPLISVAGEQPHGALFTALRAFAAYGSRRRTVEYAASLFGEAWAASPRSQQVMDVLLHALSAAPPFPGQGEQLRACAEEAVAAYPDDHTFRFRLATGQRQCARYAEAVDSLDAALRLLSTARLWDSPFRQQYLRDREVSLDLMRDRACAAVRQQAAERSDEESRQLRGRVQDPNMLIRLVGLVAVLTVTFMVFAAGIAETDPAASLRTRLGQEAALGVSLLLLTVIVTAAARFVGRHERLR